jgi:hypothetical protein
MARSIGLIFLSGFLFFLPLRGAAQTDLRLNGVWTLNRGLSEFPPEVGFNPDWLGNAPAGGSSAPSGGGGGGGRGGRGGRGGGGGGGGASSSGNNAAPVRESADDAARVRQLTAEVRTPPSRLTIVDEAAAVTVTDDSGSRTFHPHGREEALSTTTMGLPDLVVTTRREGDHLTVSYHVEEGRQLRYSYSTTSSPRQLIVEAELLERGKSVGKVRRVYDRVVPNETAAPAAPAKPLAGVPGASAPPPAAAPAGAPPRETFDQRPDAELRGLTALGFEIEELSPQATQCGLKRDTLDASLSKRLTDGGLTVLRRTSDNDTYIYVNINTTTATISQGVTLCVSRYDVFLYTHTVAKLSYTSQPVLIEVSLLHDGGIAGGGPTAHATGVQKGLEGEVDQMIAKIKGANR